MIVVRARGGRVFGPFKSGSQALAWAEAAYPFIDVSALPLAVIRVEDPNTIIPVSERVMCPEN